MTRVTRIKRIVDLASSAKRGASERLAGSRRSRDESREKLSQFERYRDEYLLRLRAGATTMSAAQARELRGFIAQVESAIKALEVQSSKAEQQYRRDVATWNQESRRTRALGDVLERAQCDHRQAEEHRSQRESDERTPPVRDDRY